MPLVLSNLHQSPPHPLPRANILKKVKGPQPLKSGTLVRTGSAGPIHTKRKQEKKDNKLLCFSLQAPSVARSSQSRRFSDGVCILPSPLSHVPTKHSSRQDPFNDNKGSTLIREHIRIESEGALRLSPGTHTQRHRDKTSARIHSFIRRATHLSVRPYVRRQFYFMYITHMCRRGPKPDVPCSPTKSVSGVLPTTPICSKAHADPDLSLICATLPCRSAIRVRCSPFPFSSLT